MLTVSENLPQKKGRKRETIVIVKCKHVVLTLQIVAMKIITVYSFHGTIYNMLRCNVIHLASSSCGTKYLVWENKQFWSPWINKL